LAPIFVIDYGFSMTEKGVVDGQLKFAIDRRMPKGGEHMQEFHRPVSEDARELNGAGQCQSKPM
jgi:hypothetical protein